MRASPWADRNAKGEGKLFNVLVADHTGDIRMTGFNETLDQYYERTLTLPLRLPLPL